MLCLRETPACSCLNLSCICTELDTVGNKAIRINHGRAQQCDGGRQIFGPEWDSHDSLSKATFQDALEGGRRRGRQRKCCMDNVKEWTSLPMPEVLTVTSRGKDRKRISAETFVMSSRRPHRSVDRTELNLHLKCIGQLTELNWTYI